MTEPSNLFQFMAEHDDAAPDPRASGPSTGRDFQGTVTAGGWYDAFLALVRPTSLVVGVCYDDQIVEHVPCEDFDVPVVAIVSPSGLLWCRRDPTGPVSVQRSGQPR